MVIPMGPAGGLLRNLGNQALRFLDKDIMAGAIRAGVSPKAVVTGGGSMKDLGKTMINMRSFQVPAGLTTVGALNDQSFTNNIENSLNQIGPGIDRTVSNIIPPSIRNPLNQFASQQEKKGFGGALEVATPFGFLGSSFIPNTPGAQAQQVSSNTLPPDAGGRAYGTQATLNGKPVVWAGKDYGWQSPKTGSATMYALNAPGVQSRFIQDAVTGSPADRDYAAKKERARQLTEQDPLFKKYQVAELSKQYNAATGDERERIGMQIWAQTNPQLAAKMKPGQTGYSDVATAFQNLSPITGIVGKMPASSFAMPAASAMPGIEQTYGASAPQVAITGFDPATAASVVAPGAFSEKSPVDITAYLKSPVEANAKFADLDQTQLGLLRQAFNQRIK
jgi:hypothetical protein